MEKEYKKFSGSWIQTYCNSDGIENPNEDYGKFPVVTFTENRFLVTNAEGGVLIEGIFSVNPNMNPKEVNWADTYGLDAGKTFPAIYEISENTLSFCAANESMCRPRTFESRLGHTIRIFKRL